MRIIKSIQVDRNQRGITVYVKFASPARTFGTWSKGPDGWKAAGLSDEELNEARRLALVELTPGNKQWQDWPAR